MLYDVNAGGPPADTSLEFLSAPAVARYIQTALPSARLKPTDTVPTASRFGGLPILDGTAWPTRQGRPLSLLAVIDLHDLWGVGIGFELPAEGVLNFFYDAQRQPWGTPDTGGQACAVVYAPAGAEPAAAPSGVAVFDEVPLSVGAELSFVHPLDDAVGGIAEADEDFYSIDDVERRLRGTAALAEPHHQVGGWPLLIQHSIPGVGSHDDAVLLLQLDSDLRAGWMWGDSGLLYFVADRNDLAQGNFDNVTAYLQCC